MPDEALPCFVCGKRLINFAMTENQPQEGTEFSTYGHYGSTVWDPMNGEELLLDICDDCLRKHPERLAQQKRWLPVVAPFVGMVGRQWVDRPPVPYTGNLDNTDVRIDVQEIGRISSVEWFQGVEEFRRYALEQQAKSEKTP